jgi:GYF domain 2
VIQPMEKIWFIVIGAETEGPYSVLDLKRDIRITPDTLAWKEGFTDWIAIRDIPELSVLFEDSPETVSDEDQKKIDEAIKKKLQDSEVIALRAEPPFYYFWLLVAFLLLCYVLYYFFEQ